jgi:hypothetical protein
MVAVTGCSLSGGTNDPGPSGTGGVGTVVPGTSTGSGGGGGAGEGGGGGAGGGETGPWPIGLSSGQVTVGRPGHYCGGPSATLLGRAQVSVPRGPVTVTLAWLPPIAGAPHAESTVEFPGGGPQSMTATATWKSIWGTTDTQVRVQVTDIKAASGAGDYILPNEHVITFDVRPCAAPDLDVTVVAVQVPPQPCGSTAQVIPVANVTLNSPLSPTTGGVTAQFRWRLGNAFMGDWIDLTFQPGGPKTIPVNAVWNLLPNRPYEVRAFVEVSRFPLGPLQFNTETKNFFTQCIS